MLVYVSVNPHGTVRLSVHAHASTHPLAQTQPP